MFTKTYIKHSFLNEFMVSVNCSDTIDIVIHITFVNNSYHNNMIWRYIFNIKVLKLEDWSQSSKFSLKHSASSLV